MAQPTRSGPKPSDLAKAAAVGILFGVSPFTPDDLVPSIVLGTLAGLIFLVYFPTFAGAAPSAKRDQPVAGSGPFEGWTAVTWACPVVFLAIFAPTLVWMYRQWTASIWINTHGLLIPIVMALLARGALREVRPSQPDTSAWGFPLVGVALALVILDSANDIHFLAAIGLVIALPGLSLLLLGKRRTFALRLSLTLAVFMIPLPNSMASHAQLRLITAAGTQVLLRAMGIPAARSHTMLELPNTTFLVSDACSGFATLITAIVITLILVYLCRSPLRRAALILCFLPLALGANVVRALVLVLLTAYVDPNVLDTPIHEATGVASFGVILTGLILLADRPSLRSAFG